MEDAGLPTYIKELNLPSQQTGRPQFVSVSGRRRVAYALGPDTVGDREREGEGKCVLNFPQ